MCEEMRGMGNYQSFSGDHARELANSIENAYERKMAAKDEEIAQLVAKCSRLERALKQILDYDFGDYAPPWKTLEVDGEMMKGCVRCGDGYPVSIVDDIIFGVDALIEMANAIGEAQRIMKEGENNG